MSKKSRDQRRARYTLEFKLEAVRLVKAGQEASVTARVLGMPKQSLSNWVRLAERVNCRASMSRRANCWDNAPTESLWGSLRLGRLYGRKFATQRAAMDEVIDRLTFYNHRRLYSTLGYVSPMKFKASWHAGQTKKAALLKFEWVPIFHDAASGARDHPRGNGRWLAWPRPQSAAGTAISERICHVTASRVRFAARSHALDPAPRRGPSKATGGAR